jgi:hypothetical protein
MDVLMPPTATPNGFTTGMMSVRRFTFTIKELLRLPAGKAGNKKGSGWCPSPESFLVSFIFLLPLS